MDLHTVSELHKTNWDERHYVFFSADDATGLINLPTGTEMVMPGDTTEMSVQLIQPIVMKDGLRFAIHEGGRTVGARTAYKLTKYFLVLTLDPQAFGAEDLCYTEIKFDRGK